MIKIIVNFLKINFLTSFSMALTIAWFWFIYGKIQEIGLPNTLSEFGDFLAGSFAPLVFYWLVLGYHLQGKGIKQNTQALMMQQQELQESSSALNLQVREMRNSIELQNLELKRQKKAYIPIIRLKDPQFIYQDMDVIDADTGEPEYFQYRGFSFFLCNVGKIALNIKITGDFDDFTKDASSSLKALVEGEEYEIKYHFDVAKFDNYFKINSEDSYECSMFLKIHYENQFDVLMEESYTITLYRRYLPEQDSYTFRMVIT